MVSCCIFFSHTFGCCEDPTSSTEKPLPQRYNEHDYNLYWSGIMFQITPLYSKRWLTIYVCFQCSGKCFVYCNGLMDHICVCENGNSKAWYKAPGHFSGTLVKHFTFLMLVIIQFSGAPVTFTSVGGVAYSHV